uniref:Uncharacterized protein n=1 Tax=Setaria viridis TaxID=4556 RepID=A0A4U6TUY8_SETVI|nr:hypothetical protein SEVIR_7G257900v2 [Setaria viridis]
MRDLAKSTIFDKIDITLLMKLVRWTMILASAKLLR